MRSTGKLRSLAVGLVALLLTAGHLNAQGSEDGMAEAMQEMQERAAEARAPGKHHAALSRFIGTWDVEMALVMPGAPRQVSKAVATYEWVVDDLWVLQRMKGELFGAPYQGATLLGFDNYAKNHVVASVSSFDTALLISRGVVVDPEDNVTSVYGTLDEYTTGELNKPYRAVTRIIDKDHHVMEVWDMGIGVEGAKVFEWSYTRKK